MNRLMKIGVLLVLGLFAFQTADAAFDKKAKRAKIKRRIRKSYGVSVIINKSVGAMAKSTATITAKGSETPKPSLKSFNMTVSKTKAGHFKLEADLDCDKKLCLFNAEVNPIGKTYILTLQPLDKNGKALGKPIATEVIIELDKGQCATNVKIKEVEFTGLDFYFPNTPLNKSNGTLIKRRTDEKDSLIPAYVYWSLDHGDKDLCIIPECMLLIEYSLPNSNKVHSYSFPATYDSKTKRYRSRLRGIRTHGRFGAQIVCSTTHTRVKFNDIHHVNNAAIAFGTKQINDDNDSDNNADDSTCYDFELKGELEMTEQTVGKLQIFTLAKLDIKNKNAGTSKSPTVKAIVHLIGCDKEDVNVSVNLKYDEKSKTFTGSEGLVLCNGNKYTVDYVTLTITNPPSTCTLEGAVPVCRVLVSHF